MGKTIRNNNKSRSTSYKSPHSHYSKGGCAERDAYEHHSRRIKNTNIIKKAIKNDTYEDNNVVLENTRKRNNYMHGPGRDYKTNGVVMTNGEEEIRIVTMDHKEPESLMRKKILERRGHIEPFSGHKRKEKTID